MRAHTNVTCRFVVRVLIALFANRSRVCILSGGFQFVDLVAVSAKRLPLQVQQALQVEQVQLFGSTLQFAGRAFTVRHIVALLHSLLHIFAIQPPPSSHTLVVRYLRRSPVIRWASRTHCLPKELSEKFSPLYHTLFSSPFLVPSSRLWRA